MRCVAFIILNLIYFMHTEQDKKRRLSLKHTQTLEKK